MASRRSEIGARRSAPVTLCSDPEPRNSPAKRDGLAAALNLTSVDA
jgi:hypothetical protein